MKAFILLVVLPLALAKSSGGQRGWGGWGDWQDWKDSSNWGWGKEDSAEKFGEKEVEVNMEDLREFYKDQMKDQEKEDDDKPEGDEMMMKKFAAFKEWAAKKMAEKQDEEEEEMKKKKMAEKFEEWRMYQMKKKMEEERERKQEEAQRAEMERIYKKQKMVQELSELSQQFKDQKFKLVHDVTFTLLEFCQCSETSSMMKKMFMTFGQPGAMEDRYENMKVGQSWFSLNMEEMAEENEYEEYMGGNSTRSGNGTMGGNGTMSGNGTMGGNATTGGYDDGDMEDMSDEERSQWMYAAKKFVKLEQKQQKKEMFHSLVKSLCHRASEYVQHLKVFENFVVMANEYKDREEDKKEEYYRR